MLNFTRPRIILSVYVFLSICLMTGCAMRDTRFHLGERNIICFGDSITAGFGADEGQDFPSLLSKSLNAPVINAGRSGDTTRHALGRLKEDVLDRNPGLVIVEFGANDFFQKISREETQENLENIVTAIQNQGALVILVSVRIGILFDEYFAVYKKVASKRKVLLIPDIMRDIFANPKLKSDEMHPNNEGYKIIAQRIYKYVAPLLKVKDPA